MVVDVRIKCASLCVWHILGALPVFAVTLHGSTCGTQVLQLTGVKHLDSGLPWFPLLYHGRLSGVIVSSLKKGNVAPSPHCSEHVKGAK